MSEHLSTQFDAELDDLRALLTRMGGLVEEQVRAATLAHFDCEEKTLFPAFEARTGIAMGPTQMMRMEHLQMRALLDEAADALAAGDGEGYLGAAETLLIMMQQHNMKEENVLYPMCDQHLAGDLPELLQHLEQELAEA